MYPEIMVIPMREELTRLGIEELRTPEAVDQRAESAAGYNPGGRELDLRMRRRPHASRRSHGSAAAPRSPTKHFPCSPGRTLKPPNAPAVISRDNRRPRRPSPFCATANSFT